MSELDSIFKLEDDFPEISTGFLNNRNNTLFTGHKNGLIIIWNNLPERYHYEILCKINGEVSSIAEFNDNSIIISSIEGELLIFNIDEKRSEFLASATFSKYNRIWRILKLSENSFLSSGTYGKLNIWNKSSEKWIVENIYPYRDTSFGLSKLDEKNFASGDYKGRLLIWEINNDKPEIVQEVYLGYNIKQVIWKDEDCVVTIGRNGTFSYLERDEISSKFKITKEFTVMYDLGTDITFSKEKKHVLAATESQVILYDIELDLIKQIEVKACINLFPIDEGIYILTKNALEYIDLSQIDIEIEKVEFKYKKVSLIGDTGVGKSTLCNILTGSKESRIYSTIGKKTWNWELNEEKGIPRNIFLQDLGGQKTALSTSLHYTLDSDIILVLFKQTDEETFNSSIELIKHLNEINKELEIYLIQTHSDQPNNDVEFKNINDILKEYSINKFSIYSCDNIDSVKEIKETLFNIISWDDSKIVIQSKVVNDIISVIEHLKSIKKLSSINLDEFKEILHQNIEITEPHLRYILKNLNDQGIIEYFPNILDTIIFNEEDYEQLKMRIPRWIKTKKGIYYFNQLIKDLANNEELKSKYIEIIDQIYQSFEYNLQIGNKRIFPSSLYLKKEYIKINNEYKPNERNKIQWTIDSQKFPIMEFLKYLKGSNYYCVDISLNTGLFSLPNKGLYFYYKYNLVEDENSFLEDQVKINFQISFNGKIVNLFPKLIRNIDSFLNFVFKNKVKMHENFFFSKREEIEVKKEVDPIIKTNNKVYHNDNRTTSQNSEGKNGDLNSISLKDVFEKSSHIDLEDNIDLEENIMIHSVFISYSHDNDDHKQWVENFASKLIKEVGINAILDKWDLNFGDLMSKFMEQIQIVDSIIIVCSPIYKNKADEQDGSGVDYEKRLIVDEIFKGNSSKIIPITPFNRREAIPRFLLDMYIAVFNEENFEEIFQQVVLNIYGKPRFKKPSLGKRPEYV